MPIQNPYLSADAKGFQDFNENNYANVMAGFKDAAANQQNFAGTINKGWNDLYGQQASYGDSQRNALAMQYKQQLADSQSSAMNRGLWNTSIADSLMQGTNANYINSSLNLNDQLLQRQNSIKQAQLGWQDQASQQYQNILGQQNQFLGGYQMAGQQQGIQQGMDYNQRLQQQWLAQYQGNNQMALQQNQQQYLYNQMQNQFANQDYIQRTYGYF